MQINRFSGMGDWKWLTEFQMLVLRAAPAPRNARLKRFPKVIFTSSTNQPASIVETAQMFARLALRPQPNKRIKRRSTEGPSEISDGLFFFSGIPLFFGKTYQLWKVSLFGPILAIIQPYEKADPAGEEFPRTIVSALFYGWFLYSLLSYEFLREEIIFFNIGCGQCG